MRFSFFLSLFFFIGQMWCGAQSVFQKTFGAQKDMWGFCVRQTSDGGYIICGNIALDSVNTDICLIRTNAAGDTLWRKTYGGPKGEFEGIVEQTNDGGYVVSGSTYSYGTGEGDIFVLKLNASGDTSWTKTYGGINDEISQYIEQTTDGGFIIGGHTDSFGVKGDFYLIKTDVQGDAVWTKNYGGAKHDHGFCVRQTNDGGYIMVGHSLSFGPSGGFYAVKTNSNGDTLWTRGYGGAMDSYGYFVEQTSDGGYILAGTTNSFGASENDALVIKINSFGDTLWARTYGGTGDEYFNCVRQTPDGNYLLLGSSSGGMGSSDVYLVKIDQTGDTLWTKTFGGQNADEGTYFDICSDSSFVIAGISRSFGSGVAQIYLLKTDQNGNGGCMAGHLQTQISAPDSVLYFVSTTVNTPSTQVDHAIFSVTNFSGSVTDVCTEAGIKNYAGNEAVVRVFPMPARDIILVESFQPIGKITIYDLNGKILNQQVSANEGTQIDISYLPPGMYILELQQRRFKIIKG